MRQVIVTIDCVGSTDAKQIYGEAHAIQMIGAAIQLAETELRMADKNLKNNGASAGDSILLVGGTDHVAIYKAAVIHQAKFVGWCYNRMPIKISIGYGEFETTMDTSGIQHSRGSDLDFLYRICDKCPAGGIVVTPAMFGMLKEAGFGNRFIKLEEGLKGLGQRVFYESDGDFVIPAEDRQRAKPGQHTTRPLPRSPAVPSMSGVDVMADYRVVSNRVTIIGTIIAALVAAFVVGHFYLLFTGKR